MLTKLNLTVDREIISQALKSLPNVDFRHTLNKPTGRFFYDPWVIKEEYKNSVWDKILQSLKTDIGEARIAILKPGTAYQSHSDIDDRFHLNLSSEKSYLIDLDDEKIYKLETNGYWYEMNAGKIHTATNFGRIDRVQLVIRKLLNDSILKDSVKIRLTSNIDNSDDTRFIFDQTISNFLNRLNKKQKISNFNFSSSNVELLIEKDELENLKNVASNNFNVELI